MRIYKKTLFWLFGITCILILLIVLLSIYHKMINNSDFIINICIGIFASSFLVLLTAIIGYNVEKKKEMTKYSNMINCFMLKIIPLFKFFNSESNINIETEIELVRSLYNYLLSHYHMNNCEIDLIFSKNRSSKLIDEIDDMLYEIYTRIIVLNNMYWELKLEIIGEDDFHDKFSELATFYRHYQAEDILFSNILGEKHKKLTKLCKIKYKKQASYDA